MVKKLPLRGLLCFQCVNFSINSAWKW